MNEELHIGLITIVSILYPLLVYRMYRKEYDTPHKRNKELHKTHNKPFTIRRGIEWPE